jgi:hypothetical protein
MDASGRIDLSASQSRQSRASSACCSRASQSTVAVRRRRFSVESILFAAQSLPLTGPETYDGTCSPDYDAASEHMSSLPESPRVLSVAADSAAQPAATQTPVAELVAATTLQAHARGRAVRASIASQHRAAAQEQAVVQVDALGASVTEASHGDVVALDAVPHANPIGLPPLPSFSRSSSSLTDVVTPPLERETSSHRRGRAALDAVPHARGVALPKMPSFSSESSLRADDERELPAALHTDASPREPLRTPTPSALTSPRQLERLSEGNEAESWRASEAGVAGTVPASANVAPMTPGRAAARLQARMRGSIARRQIKVARTAEETRLRQQVMEGAATLPDGSIRMLQGLLSAAPALAISVRAERQQLRKLAEQTQKAGKKVRALVARTTVLPAVSRRVQLRATGRSAPPRVRPRSWWKSPLPRSRCARRTCRGARMRGWSGRPRSACCREPVQSRRASSSSQCAK